MNRVTIICALLVVLALPLTGCGSKPSEADGRALLLEQDQFIPRVGLGHVELVSFQKTDGQEAKTNSGAEAYRMSFQAIVRCPGDEGCVVVNHLHGCVGEILKKGEQCTVTGVMDFERSEKGWSGRLE
jgi:hypothetical protein